MFRWSGFVVLIFSFILTACDSTNTPAFIGGSPSSVTVLPADTQVVAGVTMQYFAVAMFADGSQSDITDTSEWSAAEESVATVDSQTGLLTTLAAGTTTVTAVFRDVAGEAALTVTTTNLAQLAIIPADASAPTGTTGNYKAIGFFEDGSSEDVTTLSVWGSSDRSVVSIVADGTNAGFAEAKTPGTTDVSASFMGVNNTR
jgi:hypothetical protein